MGGGKLLLAPSLPPFTARRSEHLGEVPALDEVSGQVPGGWAMDNHPNIPPWHPGCGLPVNKIWGSKESQERGQGWFLGNVWGREEEELIKGKGCIILDPAHHILSPSPYFCPCSQLLETLEEGTLTLKRPIQLHPVLSDKIAVVLAQPEELVVRQVWGGWRV